MQELLSTPEPDFATSEQIFGNRARSASDAAVLRRKGHLKEQVIIVTAASDDNRSQTRRKVLSNIMDSVSALTQPSLITLVHAPTRIG